MKKILLFLFILLISFACSKLDKPAAVEENRFIGPIFLPENPSLNSISINYFTSLKMDTTVYFSMAGDIDWVRRDPLESNYHKMIFDGLEESAVYQFAVKNQPGRSSGLASIKTTPYGDDYTFHFALASIDHELDTNFSPNFIILYSKKSSVTESEFIQFYQKNRAFLTQTIMIPLFEFTLFDKKFKLPENGIYCIRYKNLNIVMINEALKDSESIVRYLSMNEDDKNLIVLCGVEPTQGNQIISHYGSLVETFYVDMPYHNDLNNVELLKQMKLVHIVKKEKLVYKN